MNPLKTTALVAAAAIAAFGTLARADDAAPATERPLTRAEVIADMQVWNEAGVPGMLQHRDGPQHRDFLAAFAKYEQMRAAPEFAQRVAAIARERGERLEVATSK
jgi:Domain of unknown function (DUF4148)